MKRIAYLSVLGFLAVCILSSPVQAADFGSIFPKQAGKMVTSPNFTWATGDYDFFVLVVLAPIPGYWYQPITIPRAKSYFLMPESWWDAMVTDRWGLWFVLGINTATWDYAVTPLRLFQKVTDCVVNFPDANLQSVIRGAISKPTGAIMASDLADLTVLHAVFRSISDLSGLEYCSNLTDVALSQNPISELDSLAGLTDLTVLNLYSSQIDDLTALAGLTNLEVLFLEVNQISDLGPLAWLTRLDGLDLAVNQISDVTPLSALTGLQGLDLGNNQISDITPLAALTNLWALELYDNQISDITPVTALSNLIRLYLSHNQISDLAPLASAELNLLNVLRLDENQISDIYPLVENTGLGSLWELDLSGNDLSTSSCTDYVPELQSRGIWVEHDCFWGP